MPVPIKRQAFRIFTDFLFHTDYFNFSPTQKLYDNVKHIVSKNLHYIRIQILVQLFIKSENFFAI